MGLSVNDRCRQSWSTFLIAKITTMPTRTNADLASALLEAEANFVNANPKSHARAEGAKRSMPGGNTRTVLHYTPYPLALAGGEGCYVTDIDGHRYGDFLSEFTAGLFGHSEPRIISAIKSVLDSGISLGGPNRYEADLAALLCARFPSLERVRFCNSGTEGNLFAVSAARAFTKRDKVMVFDGGYHGGVFYFGQTKGAINAPFPYVMGAYNDAERTLGLIELHAADLAVVVVEPMQGSGCIPATRDFLAALREATARHGIVLQFDEVMTSRLAPGGLQGHLGITPDMTALGKYLGGGMTFGAFGGRADIMAMFDPYRPGATPHGGTFNNNVLSMAAGLTGMRDIFTPEVAVALNASGDALRERLNGFIANCGAAMQATGRGSMLTIHFQRGSIERPEQTWMTGEEAKRHEQLRALFHFDMLAAGQYLARRGFMALSLPMTAREHDGFAAAFEDFLRVRRPLLEN